MTLVFPLGLCAQAAWYYTRASLGGWSLCKEQECNHSWIYLSPQKTLSLCAPHTLKLVHCTVCIVHTYITHRLKNICYIHWKYLRITWFTLITFPHVLVHSLRDCLHPIESNAINILGCTYHTKHCNFMEMYDLNTTELIQNATHPTAPCENQPQENHYAWVFFWYVSCEYKHIAAWYTDRAQCTQFTTIVLVVGKTESC